MASWLGGPGAWLGGPAACLGGLREVGPGDDEGEADGVDEYTETKTALAEALAKSSISPQTALIRYLLCISCSPLAWPIHRKTLMFDPLCRFEDRSQVRLRQPKAWAVPAGFMFHKTMHWVARYNAAARSGQSSVKFLDTAWLTFAG
jgi:hypothetical protein